MLICVIMFSQGYRIPKGTLVLSNVWAAHHDPRTHDRPDEFQPRRFLDVSKAQEAAMLMPFGVGMRQCTGLNLGLQEVRTLGAEPTTRRSASNAAFAVA